MNVDCPVKTRIKFTFLACLSLPQNVFLSVSLKILQAEKYSSLTEHNYKNKTVKEDNWPDVPDSVLSHLSPTSFGAIKAWKATTEVFTDIFYFDE